MKKTLVVRIPCVSAPAREAWLYRNMVALGRVRRGLAQSKRGELRSLGSFAKFAKDFT